MAESKTLARVMLGTVISVAGGVREHGTRGGRGSARVTQKAGSMAPKGR